ncbi:Calmodulin [Hondaea fermentalgiana]|uniref:Calmodulin n=1 Tax=Hondaea fermentalgiana TaxID=2315210 RepID=A0A2R5GYS6_9STRA|nr:Calmodulin [Hondaea fermentalgiana]|eukprot:GBG33621.1 Calmodulin [Hondaea fermentalgiana]
MPQRDESKDEGAEGNVMRGMTWRGEWDGEWAEAWDSQQNLQQDTDSWFNSAAAGSYALTDEQREELRGIFEVSAQSRVDKAFEGEEALVHRKQLGELMQMLGIVLTDEEANRLVQEVTLQNHDEMRFEEFCDVAARVYASYDVHEEIKEAFVAMRENTTNEVGEQFVSAQSLLQTFRANGNESISEEDCARIVALVGTSAGPKSTMISWTDFQYHMMSSAF